MGAASLVLSLIALVIAVFAPVYGWVAIILGVVGIILAAVAKKKGQKGVATAGLVISIIATSLALLFWLACALCVASVGAAAGML